MTQRALIIGDSPAARLTYRRELDSDRPKANAGRHRAIQLIAQAVAS